LKKVLKLKNILKKEKFILKGRIGRVDNKNNYEESPISYRLQKNKSFSYKKNPCDTKIKLNKTHRDYEIKRDNLINYLEMINSYNETLSCITNNSGNKKKPLRSKENFRSNFYFF